MSESILVPIDVSKEEKYQTLIPQLRSLIESESDVIANMANISAALKEVFGFFWVGFYIVKEDELVLGPFQGPIACTRIKYGRGVCGTSWKNEKTIVVPDVDKFPGHIACSSLSKSEIVIPLFHNNSVFAVLDVDSDFYNEFDKVDEIYLKQICELIVLQA